MTLPPSPLTPHHSPIEEGAAVEGYHSISGMAIAGLILGGLSALAYEYKFFWSLAFAGVVVNGLALKRIAASGGAMVGRRTALVGLTCSLLFGSTAVTHSLLEPFRVRAEARRFALDWFTAIEEGDFEKAFELVDPHWVRLPLDESLKPRYEKDPSRQAKLDNFLNQEPLRTLRSCRSRPQYVRNASLQLAVDHYDEINVVDVYEVSVDRGGSPDSRLLQIELRKLPNLVTQEWGWHVKKASWLDSPPAGLSARSQ